jgi:hypothetical protein
MRLCAQISDSTIIERGLRMVVGANWKFCMCAEIERDQVWYS